MKQLVILFAFVSTLTLAHPGTLRASEQPQPGFTRLVVKVKTMPPSAISPTAVVLESGTTITVAASDIDTAGRVESLSTPTITAAAPNQWMILKIKTWSPETDGTSVTLESGQSVRLGRGDVDTARQGALVMAWNPVGGTAPDKAPDVTAVAAPALDTSIIRPKCAKEWPDDFSVRAYCEKTQNEAVTKLKARSMTTPDERTIRSKCAKEWPDDFSVRNYCEETQLTALKIVK